MQNAVFVILTSEGLKFPFMLIGKYGFCLYITCLTLFLVPLSSIDTLVLLFLEKDVSAQLTYHFSMMRPVLAY